LASDAFLRSHHLKRKPTTLKDLEGYPTSAGRYTSG
jgi:hypothetical protein